MAKVGIGHEILDNQEVHRVRNFLVSLNNPSSIFCIFSNTLILNTL